MTLAEAPDEVERWDTETQDQVLSHVNDRLEIESRYPLRSIDESSNEGGFVQEHSGFHLERNHLQHLFRRVLVLCIVIIDLERGSNLYDILKTILQAHLFSSSCQYIFPEAC